MEKTMIELLHQTLIAAVKNPSSVQPDQVEETWALTRKFSSLNLPRYNDFIKYAPSLEDQLFSWLAQHYPY